MRYKLTGTIRSLLKEHGSIIGATIEQAEDLRDMFDIDGIDIFAVTILVAGELYIENVMIGTDGYKPEPDDVVDFYPDNKRTPGRLPVLFKAGTYNGEDCDCDEYKDGSHHGCGACSEAGETTESHE